MQSYDIHPICQIIPLMNHDDINRLAEDIVQNGLLEPIVLYEGKILDGRHRYEACARCGVPPRFVDYDGSDPIQFVLSHNIARRHLTPSQLSMIAARVANMRVGGREANAQICAIGSVSQDDAADQVGVSRRSVQSARKVIDSGRADLVEAVDRGEMSVHAATEIVRREVIGEPAAPAPDMSIAQKNLRKWWLKATDEERAEFIAWAEGTLDDG